jgi:UDP-glucose 4-epimerase
MADAHVLAMKEEAANQTYNLEGRRQVTILEVAELMRKLLGDQVNIEFIPERPGDFAGKEVSAEKARLELSWRPVVEFEDGLKRTIAWFRTKWDK